MVTSFRPYRLKNSTQSGFLKVSTTVNDDFCSEDLGRSALTSDDVLATSTGDVMMPRHAQAGYVIPYFDVNGRVLTERDGVTLAMYRARYKVPQLSKEPRYMQPAREALEQIGLPAFVPYLLPYNAEYDNGVLYCVEGEKKTAAVIKHCKVAAFGIAGCQMWRNPNGEGGIHPWILEYARLHKASKIIIIPDADVLRYDMSQCYGTYATLLKREGFEVDLLHPPSKIDDIIAEKNGAVAGLLDSLERISDLVQSPAALAEQYGLAFDRSTTGKIRVHQNLSNVMLLLNNHPAFPRLWKNLDSGRVMLGAEPAIPDVTEVLISNHFQHFFGMPAINSRMVMEGIGAIAKQNAISPLLERIKSTDWDRVERLDTWMINHWGVQDTPRNRQIARKWLVASCARMDKPGTKIDWMLIVIGPQGVGKTSMPGLFFGETYTVLYGETDDKDLQMIFGSSNCVGFDELESFGKRESGTLKAMVTRQIDRFRPPYGRTLEDVPRRTLLYGSGNRREFLQNDPSGYRRYAIIEAPRKLDFKEVEALAPQLWAEAWHIYKTEDISFWEIEGDIDADQYSIPNPLEDQVWGAIWAQYRARFGTQQGNDFTFSMAQLLSWLGEQNCRNSSLNREIAGILTNWGAANVTRRVDGRVTRVWVMTMPSQS